MAQSSAERMQSLVRQLQTDPGIAETLPGPEGQMIRDALAGLSVYEIAQQQQVSERRVWDVLASAARAATGRELHQVETGGFGSDTDPGVTGGYGETGFGSIGNEPDVAFPEEPSEG